MRYRKIYTPPIAEILPSIRQSCEDANTLYLDLPDGKRHIFRDGEYAGWYMP